METTTLIETTEAVRETINNIASCGVLEIFKDIVAIIGGILGAIVAATTIAVFLKTYVLKNIRFFGFNIGSGIWDGHYINITIQNLSLSAVSIQKVEFIVDNKVFYLKNYGDEPLVLKPLEIAKVSNDNSSTNILKNVDLNDPRKFKVLIHFTGGAYVVRKFAYRKRPFNYKKYEKVMSKPIKRGDLLITDWVRYYLVIKKDAEVIFETLIDKQGHLKDAFNGCNVIPAAKMKDSDTVKEHLAQFINDETQTISLEHFYVE